VCLSQFYDFENGSLWDTTTYFHRLKTLKFFLPVSVEYIIYGAESSNVGPQEEDDQEYLNENHLQKTEKPVLIGLICGVRNQILLYSFSRVTYVNGDFRHSGRGLSVLSGIPFSALYNFGISAKIPDYGIKIMLSYSKGFGKGIPYDLINPSPHYGDSDVLFYEQFLIFTVVKMLRIKE